MSMRGPLARKTVHQRGQSGARVGGGAPMYANADGAFEKRVKNRQAPLPLSIGNDSSIESSEQIGCWIEAGQGPGAG